MATPKKTENVEIPMDEVERTEIKKKTHQLGSGRIFRTFSAFGNTQFLVLLLLVGSFLLGSMYTKIQYLQTAAAVPPVAIQANAQAAAPAPTAAPLVRVDIDPGHLPIKGDPNAKVTVIEFADLRCPFCEQYFTDVEPQLLKEYVDTGKVKFAFRHYAFLGAPSTVAANAAECANEQGKFWDMYNYLYTNQPSESDTTMYTVDKLTPIATTLGMNADQFRTCLSTNKYNQNVTDDFTAGQKAGVSGTPTTFINGMPIVGAVPYAQVKAAIDAELAK